MSVNKGTNVLETDWQLDLVQAENAATTINCAHGFKEFFLENYRQVYQRQAEELFNVKYDYFHFNDEFEKYIDRDDTPEDRIEAMLAVCDNPTVKTEMEKYAIEKNDIDESACDFDDPEAQRNENTRIAYELEEVDEKIIALAERAEQDQVTLAYRHAKESSAEADKEYHLLLEKIEEAIADTACILAKKGWDVFHTKVSEPSFWVKPTKIMEKKMDGVKYDLEEFPADIVYALPVVRIQLHSKDDNDPSFVYKNIIIADYKEANQPYVGDEGFPQNPDILITVDHEPVDYAKIGAMLDALHNKTNTNKLTNYDVPLTVNQDVSR